MAIEFLGAQLFPGDQGLLETTEEQIWFGRDDQQVFGQGVIASTTTDAGNTGSTNILRPGLLLGENEDSELVPWDPFHVGTSGNVQNYIAGIFLGNLNMNFYGTATRRFSAVLVGGRVYADRLIIPGNTSAGIAGDDYEFLVREQLKHRFLFSDDLVVSGYETPKYRSITSGTAFTITEDMHNTHFVCEAVGGAFTFTTPAPKPGFKFKVTNGQTGSNIIVDGPATGEFINIGGAANTVTILAANNETVEFEGVRTAATPTYQYATNILPAT